jgi:hypothetical protein
MREIGDVEASRAPPFLKIEQAVNRTLSDLEVAKSGGNIRLACVRRKS